MSNDDRPLESLRERQIARGLLANEVEWFIQNRGRVPLCDAQIIVDNTGATKVKCGMYGPLPALEFTEVCLRCQKEIIEQLEEEERLYRKATVGMVRR